MPTSATLTLSDSAATVYATKCFITDVYITKLYICLDSAIIDTYVVLVYDEIYGLSVVYDSVVNSTPTRPTFAPFRFTKYSVLL